MARKPWRGPLAKLTQDDVDDLIDRWADSYVDRMPLHEFLGWTPEQYARYVEDGEIPEEEKPESD